MRLPQEHEMSIAGWHVEYIRWDEHLRQRLWVTVLIETGQRPARVEGILLTGPGGMKNHALVKRRHLVQCGAPLGVHASYDGLWGGIYPEWLDHPCSIGPHQVRYGDVGFDVAKSYLEAMRDRPEEAPLEIHLYVPPWIGTKQLAFPADIPLVGV